MVSTVNTYNHLKLTSCESNANWRSAITFLRSSQQLFFCPIKRSFQGFILSKGSSLRLWKWLKISWCSSLKTKKASSYSQLELEPVLKSKAIDYLLPCVQNKCSKKFFSVYYWSFPVTRSEQLSSYWPAKWITYKFC